MVLSADPRAAQAAKTAQPAPRRRRARRWHWLVLAIALTALLLFPLYWMLVSSVDSISSLFSVNLSLLPNFGDLGSYAEIFRNYQVGLWLGKRAVATAGAGALSLTRAAPG